MAEEKNVTAYLNALNPAERTRIPISVYFVSQSNSYKMRFEKSRKHNSEKYPCMAFFKPISQIVDWENDLLKK